MSRFAFIVLLILQAGIPLWAQGKKPPKKTQKKESGTTLKDAEKGANRALDGVEKAVKEGAGTLNTEGNKTLQSVDDMIHSRK